MSFVLLTQNLHLGLLTNDSILDISGELKEKLREGEDYRLLTYEAWTKLIHNGAGQSIRPTIRQVIINTFASRPEAIVEVYPLTITVLFHTFLSSLFLSRPL